jgi:hypothetical protein
MENKPIEKPISKMTSMTQLLLKLNKGNPSEAEQLEIKQRLEKLRGKNRGKKTVSSEPTLGEKTMMLRKYYAEKYGNTANNTSKIIDLIEDSCDLKPSPKNEWFSPSECIFNSEEIPSKAAFATEGTDTADGKGSFASKSILQQLDNDYEIIEIKFSMRKKLKPF